MYENSYGTRIVVPISLGSYNGVDEFNATIDSLVDGNVPLIMPFMHTFGYDADWITQEAFEKVVDWKTAVSAAIVAGVVSALTSVAGIPEVEAEGE